MIKEKIKPNRGKRLIVEVDGKKYARYPIKTHIIKEDDNISQVIQKYAGPHLLADDLIFISEKIIAITQGRAFPIKDIKPSKLARFLVKFVHKSPYGIGIGSPWTMELAIREAGAGRLLLAAAISTITKLFGIKGVFYKVVGKNVNAIDGPCDYTLPPYNKYASLAPKNPQKVAQELQEKVNHNVVIIDANDLGVTVLGNSSKLSNQVCAKIFEDNPLGQTNEQTPICLVREI
jgi:F420-0:gamma-glutamyl ligase-like protein